MAGAENPDDFDIELTSAKLKNGASYTLLVNTYGVLAALDFVAVKAKKRAVRKKKKASPKKKTAARKKPAACAAKKKVVRGRKKKAA